MYRTELRFTTYYATGEAAFHVGQRGMNNKRFSIGFFPRTCLYHPDHNNTHPFYNPEVQFGILFFPNPSLCPHPDTNPLLERNFYWIQADRFSFGVLPRFLGITDNSGTFRFNCPNGRIEEVWEGLKAAYATGKLGYGLQCTTARWKGDFKLITVHTEDGYNLDQVAAIAWEIDQVIGEWKGCLYYYLDKSNAYPIGSEKAKPLFLLPNSSFQNPRKSYPHSPSALKKTKEMFIRLFKTQHTELANENKHLYSSPMQRLNSGMSLRKTGAVPGKADPAGQEEFKPRECT